jgi:hypothetical protein
VNGSPAKGSGRLRLRLVMAVLAACGGWSLGCGGKATTVEFFHAQGLDADYEFSAEERQLIEATAVTAVDEVRALLPGLPERVTIRVHAGTDVIPETGEAGTAASSMVLWTVNPSRGVSTVTRAWLRACLFHELHHMVRDAAVPRRTLLDNAVAEGLATAFERDFAGVSPPWGMYPADVDAWLEELKSLPPNTERKGSLSRLPDGRRWVALKVGTYLADRVRERSGRSAAQLVSTSTEEVLKLSAASQGTRGESSR